MVFHLNIIKNKFLNLIMYMCIYYYLHLYPKSLTLKKTNLPIYEKQTLFSIPFYFAFYN